MEKLGTIISTVDGPSTRRFSFVVESNVKKGQFVCVGSEKKLIGVVQDIIRSNRYFERAESVAEYERAPNSFIDSFPVGEWEYVTADVLILGQFDGKKSERCFFPPSPGEKVYTVPSEELSSFIGFEKDGLNIGALFHHDVSVKLNMQKMLQKHLAVLAQSGAGKSHFVSVLLEELMKRPKEKGRIGAVVFDVHGEYVGFAHRENKEFAQNTKIFDGKKIKIGCRDLSLYSFRQFSPEITSVGLRELGKIVDKLKNNEEGYDLEMIIEELGKLNQKENIIAPLISWIKGLKSLHLFSKATNPSISEILKPGQLSIFDFSSIIDLKKKQIILSFFLKKMFSARRRNKTPPFLVVVEEAHNFAKEKTKYDYAIARGIIETVAREGRKFGASLCLVSQRPVQLSTTALSQCNTFAIFRITNPYDLKHIGESCEGIDSKTLDQITTLKTGEGIFIGEGVNVPVFVKVRDRLTKKASREKPLDKMAVDYEKENQVLVEDEELQTFV